MEKKFEKLEDNTKDNLKIEGSTEEYNPLYMERKYAFPPRIKFTRAKFQRGLIIAIVVAELFSHKADIKNLINLARVVAENDISVEELQAAVDGMVPEKNVHITDYNNFLNEVTKAKLDSTTPVDDVDANFTLNYDIKDKDIISKIEDKFIPDTIEESESKYKQALSEDLQDVKKKTMDANVLDEKSFGEKLQDAWTGLKHFFGGKSVEENNECDTMKTIKKYTQFVFDGTEEEGLTYERLSRQSKIDTLDVLLYAYQNMERRYPDFKDSLDGDSIYPTLESRVNILKEFNEKTELIDQDEKTIRTYLGNYDTENNTNFVKQKTK